MSVAAGILPEENAYHVNPGALPLASGSEFVSIGAELELYEALMSIHQMPQTFFP